MKNRLVRTTSMLVILVALLSVAAGAAWGYDAERGGHKPASPAVNQAEQADDASLIALALVCGTALLAGGVWMGQMRRMISWGSES